MNAMATSGIRRLAVAVPLFLFAAKGVCRTPDLDALQREAGRPVELTVTRFIPAERVEESLLYTSEENQLAIVQAGRTRALVLSASTILRAGESYRLRLIFLENVVPPPGLGLPNPVGLYREAFLSDQVRFDAANREAILRRIAPYREPGALARFTITREQAGALTVARAEQGLLCPVDQSTRYFFTAAPAATFRLAEMVLTLGHYELRLVHPESGVRAVAFLPGTTSDSLARAPQGASVNVTGWIEEIVVSPEGIVRNRFLRRESDFAAILEARVVFGD